MIIVCNSCSAQYSVSDAKVRGKLVRITCKHCSTAIVVDGRQMMESEAASQKPLSGYALPRRDESVVAAMPHSVAPSRVHSPAPAPAPAPARPASAPMQSFMSAAMREEDQTMVQRSKFGDDMSVHDERTVIGQIPKEALEFERMFAQRTQPPPPDAPSAPVAASPPTTPVPDAPSSSSLAAEPSASSAPPAATRESSDDEAEGASAQGFSRSEPPTVGNQPTSDSRGLVSLAEATHPSVVRAVSARRLRVTLIALFVLAVLLLLFVIQMPR